MQTFLPSLNFEASAHYLDNKRLGKQRLECKWILDSALGKTKRSNHPAAVQWYGYEVCLAQYAMAMCAEWADRGYEDTMYDMFSDYFLNGGKLVGPPWLGYEPYHSMHRSVLLDKDFDHYSKFGWKEERAKKNDKGSYPYVWPSKMKEFNKDILI